MFADQTLTPKEATRLAALGTLASGPRSYGTLAIDVRHFIGRVIGPSPEIMGHSIELLRNEGLVETVSGEGDEAVLRLSESGRRALTHLITARVRPADTALNKLVIALKFRFLHLLEPEEQRAQADHLLDVCEQELARLEDLRAHHIGEAGHLEAWLDHDLSLLEQRRGWLSAFRDRLA